MIYLSILSMCLPASEIRAKTKSVRQIHAFRWTWTKRRNVP